MCLELLMTQAEMSGAEVLSALQVWHVKKMTVTAETEWYCQVGMTRVMAEEKDERTVVGTPKVVARCQLLHLCVYFDLTMTEVMLVGTVEVSENPY